MRFLDFLADAKDRRFKAQARLHADDHQVQSIGELIFELVTAVFHAAIDPYPRR